MHHSWAWSHWLSEQLLKFFQSGRFAAFEQSLHLLFNWKMLEEKNENGAAFPFSVKSLLHSSCIVYQSVVYLNGKFSTGIYLSLALSLSLSLWVPVCHPLSLSLSLSLPLSPRSPALL